MKFGELKSIGHNIADSLASGIGLLIGVYEMDVFGEAQQSPDGVIVVDFLSGEVTVGTPSQKLRDAVKLYSGALADLCERHGATMNAFSRLTARYGVDAVYGGHFAVTVEDNQGRSSTDQYVGVPGKRLRRAQHR